MTPLEQELLALEIDWPETPDLAGGLETRLGRPARRDRLWSRPLAVSLAALVVAAGAVLAFSPGARSALLELFGIEGATVTRVDELPALQDPGEVGVGEPVSLEQAREAVPFRILLPAGERIGEVGLDRRVGSGAVSVAWCCPRIVLTQFRGTTTPYAQKLAGPGTLVEYVSVGGAEGVWIEGAPHGVFFRDDSGDVLRAPRLARNVLLWEQGDVTLRLEGDISKERALAIAERVR